jgi:predicted acyl esterase
MSNPNANYPGFYPGETILRNGDIWKNGAAPLSCDIKFLHDVAVPLRDGVTIYVDIFLPSAMSEPCPVITSYSPYGKTGSGFQNFQTMNDPYVDVKKLSGLQSWEACDPALWCAHGYAVCQPDARGAFMSEGNIHFWGKQEGMDTYDLIEWLAGQIWCNGKIGLAGNSWLAVNQYFAAVQQPPHLAAIAPWEGQTDLLGDDVLNGGIPNLLFASFIQDTLYGNNETQDIAEMVRKHPYICDFWQDKRPELEKIITPAYITASYSSTLHTRGTFEAFERISSKEKWLRVHNTGEWRDFYSGKYHKDLMKFMDCFLKGDDNGWGETPKVRISVIDPGGSDIVDRPESAYPIPGYRATCYYLSITDNRLKDETSDVEESCFYYSEAPNASIEFRKTFAAETEIVGPSKLKLWVEADGCNDMDIYIRFEKIDASGQTLLQTGIGDLAGPYAGPDGRLRVSRRKLDRALSTDTSPRLAFSEEEFLEAGKIVPVEIALKPTGLIFHTGETMRLTIAASRPSAFMPEGAPGDETAKPLDIIAETTQSPFQKNCKNIFHCGGTYDSHLVLPIKQMSLL